MFNPRQVRQPPHSSLLFPRSQLQSARSFSVENVCLTVTFVRVWPMSTSVTHAWSDVPQRTCSIVNSTWSNYCRITQYACAAVEDKRRTVHPQRHSSLQNGKQHEVNYRSSVGCRRVGCPGSAADRKKGTSHLYKLQYKYIRLITFNT